MLPHEVCSSPTFSGLTTALSNGSMSIPDIIHSPRFFTLGIENNKTDSTINHDTYSTGWKWDMKQDTQAKSKSKKKLSASLPLSTMSPILKCHMYFKNNNNKKKTLRRIDYTLKHIKPLNSWGWMGHLESHSNLRAEQGQLQGGAQGGVLLILNIPKNGDATTSLACLWQWLITFTVKGVFPMLKWNFLNLSLCPSCKWIPPRRVQLCTPYIYNSNQAGGRKHTCHWGYQIFFKAKSPIFFW